MIDDNLIFRRQFLLLRELITEFPSWKSVRFNHYHLYYHPDLEVNQKSDQRKCLIIIGDIYDFANFEKDNGTIVQDIFSEADSFGSLVNSIKKYVGCYVVLFHDDENDVAFTDTRGMKEVYYCTRKNRVILGSQPHLVARFADPAILPSNNSDLIEFYEKHLWDSRWVGDETYFDGIRHLIPNHYVNIKKHASFRYWPNAPIHPIQLKEAVAAGCEFLQGAVTAMVNRHPIMMAVTAGSDSRTLLAASRGSKNSIYYFVNDEKLGENHTDIVIPKKMFNHLHIPFHVHSVPEDVDEKFKKIYHMNTFLATGRLLPSIYNVYYKEHSDKRYMQGIGEVGRTFYGKAPKRLSGHLLAYLLGYPHCRYAIDQCEKIKEELFPVARNNGINVMALFYWEQRLGNWAATRVSESSIAINKVDPFNSHILYELLLGVDERYKNYLTPSSILFQEMIRAMWPELLQWPINPPTTLRGSIKSVLAKWGIFGSLKKMKYYSNYFKHRITNH